MSVDEAKKRLEEQVLSLYQDGAGRNEIARTLHVSTYRVDQAARAQGLEFDSSRTQEAVKALKSRAEYEREELASMWRDIAAMNLHNALAEAEVPTAAYPFVKNAAVATEKDALIAKTLSGQESSNEQEQAGAFLGSFMESICAQAADLADGDDGNPTRSQRGDPP